MLQTKRAHTCAAPDPSACGCAHFHLWVCNLRGEGGTGPKSHSPTAPSPGHPTLHSVLFPAQGFRKSSRRRRTDIII